VFSSLPYPYNHSLNPEHKLAHDFPSAAAGQFKELVLAFRTCKPVGAVWLRDVAGWSVLPDGLDQLPILILFLTQTSPPSELLKSQ
jgi:hypothetical protein